MDIKQLTEIVIKCAFRVHNALGSGYLERVYENALRLDLEAEGLHVRQQAPIQVRYRGQVVGDFIADLVVESRLIVEIKAVQKLAVEHEVQLVNYLTATGIDDGLLVNFGPSVEVRHKYRVYRPRASPSSS